MLIQGTAPFQYENTDHTRSGVIVAPDADTAVVPAKSASFVTAGFPIHQTYGYLVGLSWPATGTPVGTLSLQVSVDPSLNNDFQPDAGLVTWFDLPSATYALTGIADSVAFEATVAMARWVRVKWTRTSGDLTLTARVQYKGIR